MNTKDTEVFASPWKHMAETWSRFGVGNHPSSNNIRTYERYMNEVVKEVPEPSVVIFGSTPEIRDMLASYENIFVTILDVNKEMTRAMKGLMKRETDRETWIEGNWLDVPLQANSFDVVFGDHIRCNVAFEDQEKLFQNIHGILKPEGAFVTRLITRFDESPVYDPKEIIEKYSKIEPSKQSISELLNILMFMTHTNQESTTDYLFAQLEAYASTPNIQVYLTEIEQMLPRGKAWNIGRGWKENSKEMFFYFDISDKTPCDTFFKDMSFVYKLIPKEV